MHFIFGATTTVQLLGNLTPFTGNVLLSVAGSPLGGGIRFNPAGPGGNNNGFANSNLTLDANVSLFPRDAQGNLAVGGLNGAPGTSLAAASVTAGNFSYVEGLPGVTSTFQGNITGGAAIGLLVKAGTFVFGGTNSTWSAVTTINPGATLQVGLGNFSSSANAPLGVRTTAGGLQDNGLLVFALNPSGSILETSILSNANSTGVDIQGNGGVQDLISSATLLLNQPNNSYTGSTEVDGSTIQLEVLANGGTNSAIGASGSAATNLILNGATVLFDGSNATSTNHLFSIGNSTSNNGATILSSGTGDLNFTNVGSLIVTNTVISPTLTLAGSHAGVNTFSPAIVDNGQSSTNFIKDGGTVWNLAGASTYTGTTVINNGRLAVTGSLGNTSVSMASSGSTLLGSGTIGGTVTVNQGGISPGYNVVSDGAGGTTAIGGPANISGNLVASNLTVGALNASNGLLSFTFNPNGGNTTLGTTDMYNGIVVTHAGGLTLGANLMFNFYVFNGSTDINTNINTAWSNTGAYNLFQYTGSLNGIAGGNLASLSAANVFDAVNGDLYTFGTTTSGGLNYLYVNIAVIPPNFSYILTGDGNWSNISAWTFGEPGVGGNTGVVATFPAFNTALANVTVDTTPLLSGLSFTSGNPFDLVSDGNVSHFLSFSNGGNASTITVSKGNVTIGANSLVDGGGLSISIANNSTLTISGNIAQSAAAAVTMASSTGTLVLSGNNTFTAGLTLIGGNLDLNAGGNATASPLGTSASLFTIDGGNLDNTSGSPVTIGTNNPIALNATLKFIGSNDLNLGTGAFTLLGFSQIIAPQAGPTSHTSMADLIGDNGDGFGITVTGNGTLILGNTGTHPFTGLTLIQNGNLTLMGSLTSAVNTTGNATLTLGGGNSSTGAMTLGGNTTIASTGGNLANTSITANTGNVTISANIVGNSNVTKSGNGNLFLGGTNSFNGGLTLTGGNLNVSTATAAGSGNFNLNGGTLINNSGSSLTLTTNNPIYLGGTFTFGGTNALNLGK